MLEKSTKIKIKTSIGIISVFGVLGFLTGLKFIENVQQQLPVWKHAIAIAMLIFLTSLLSLSLQRFKHTKNFYAAPLVLLFVVFIVASNLLWVLFSSTAICLTIWLCAICLSVYFDRSISVSFFAATAIVISVPALLALIPIPGNYVFVSTIWLIVTFTISTALIFRSRIGLSELRGYKSAITNNDPILTVSILAFLILFVFKASIFEFMWDELNSYFFIAYQFVLNGHTHIPEKPSTVMTMGNRFIGQGLLTGIFSGADRVAFTLIMKTTTALLLISMICLIASEVFKSTAKKRVATLLLLSMPVFTMTVVGNFSDLINFAVCGYAICIVSQRTELKETKPAVGVFEFFCLGLFFFLSLKSLIGIIALGITLVVLGLRTEISLRALFLYFGGALGFLGRLLIALVPISMLALRNYLSTGNPIYPVMNYFFESEYFHTEKAGVSAGFSLQKTPDFWDLVSLFSSSPIDHQKFYWGGFFAVYGLVPMVTMAWMIVLKLMFGKNPLSVYNRSGFAASRMDLVLKTLFVSSVLTTFFIIGPELRYFVGVMLIVILGASTPLVLLFVQSMQNISKRLLKLPSSLLYIMLLGFSLLNAQMINVGHGPYSLKEDRTGVVSQASKKWWDSLAMYQQFNLMHKGEKVILYYLQDKFFFDSPNTFENDWYDWKTQSDLTAEFNATDDETQRYKNVLNYLCGNGFGYAALNRSMLGPLEDEFSKKILSTSDKSIWKLKCDTDD